MMKNITLGQYFPGRSVIHRLDPRIKILLSLTLLVLVFFIRSLWGFAAFLCFVLLVSVLAQIPVKYLLRGLKPLIFIVFFTFILNLFFASGGQEIFRWQFIRITDAGLKNAVFLAARLIMLVISTSLLTLTTSPISLTDGIESLLSPLKAIKFPAHELAMMMSIALRFIPTLMDEADRIMKAQKARGADFDTGGLIRRAKAMIPLLVPLFLSAFRHADELALAMEARCYRGGKGRTRLKVLKLGWIDFTAGVVTAVLFAGLLAGGI
ncbi:MAG: energy-coupling factor transporter transmembrane component T family protein [Christensenellales bacterium]